MNKPAEFINKYYAETAMYSIAGPQVVKKEVVGRNIKVYWNNGTTSLAPAWWFHKFQEMAEGE